MVAEEYVIRSAGGRSVGNPDGTCKFRAIRRVRHRRCDQRDIPTPRDKKAAPGPPFCAVPGHSARHVGYRESLARQSDFVVSRAVSFSRIRADFPDLPRK